MCPTGLELELDLGSVFTGKGWSSIWVCLLERACVQERRRPGFGGFVHRERVARVLWVCLWGLVQGVRPERSP